MGGREPIFDGCTGYHKRGRAICSNRHELSMGMADEALLAQFETAVLSPDVIEDAVQVALERLRPTLEARLQTREHLERERAALGTEIDRLVAAIAGGGSLSGLVEGLQAREVRRRDLGTQIATLNAHEAVLAVQWPTVRARLVERLSDWRQLLRAHVPQARQLLRKLLVGPIRLTPVDRGYRYEARIGLRAILLGIIDPTSVASPTGTCGNCTEEDTGGFVRAA